MLCFATNNRHKLFEVGHLLGKKFKLVSLQDLNHHEELAEDFLTLEENARQKAEFIFRKYKIPCFADDTGLEVAALNGKPGVLSARYAGPQKNSDDNISLLLENLKGQSLRSAQFRTVIVLVGEDYGVQSFEGKVEGTIIDQPRGTKGFGYDPVFVPTGYNITLAEMTVEEKNSISHRAIAVHKLVRFLLEQTTRV